jgi:hypothetical protein
MSSKAKPKPFSLSDLRQHCGGRQNNHWIFQPRSLKPQGTPKQPAELSALVDTRPLADVEAELTAAIQQILARAYSGDSTALHRFARIVCGAAEALDTLTDFRQGAVKVVAEKSSAWPVLLSLNPQQIQHARRKLITLGVGRKAPARTRVGQRIDPCNFWTRLAANAFSIIRFNRHLVPLLKGHSRGAAKKRTYRNIWSQKLGATIYTRNDGDIICIPDWCGGLCNLSEPVTRANLAGWQRAIKLCVMDYWRIYPTDYQKALRQIGQRNETESRRRYFALARIDQAFRSLVQ